MSQLLDPIDFPLHGARLIEASAGTGKTWTIAALYVRLVLGHGGERGFIKPLQPSEILVMTFTRAATRELSDRIRARLVEAAAFFRGEAAGIEDDFLQQLADCYPEQQMCEQAARRLMLAAEAMDESAVFTIDAWCQRMLREHAFDSGCLFDEELISSERQLRKDAVRDYWRHHVYSLERAALASVQMCWMDLEAFESAIGGLIERAHLLECAQQETLSSMLARLEQENRRCANLLRKGWADKAARLQAWLEQHRAAISGTKLQPATAAGLFQALQEWADSDNLVKPRQEFFKGAPKMVPDALQAAFNKGKSVPLPPECAELESLLDALNAIAPLEHALLTHAAVTIAKRMAELKRRSRQFGFADMLSRLKEALHGANGEALRKRIVAQYPVALIDEFQDTSPDQYRIFDALYRVAEENTSLALFMIGDPKQAIYGFRGADIHSYLAARRATEGRHFRLTRNFRSTESMVRAVNHLFLHAEGGTSSGHPRGAFGFRDSGANPLPFEEVTAHGRKECLVADGKGVAALTIWSNENDGLVQETYRSGFAAQCAERIATLLNDPGAGFSSDAGFERLRPADIAILVRDRYEADAVRAELERRRVPSVYLSDKDSVFDSDEAADVLRWLHAVSNPLDGALGRAAYATRTVGFGLPLLAEIAADDTRWDACIEQLKAWRQVWQRHGVLAMLRQLIHDLDIPARLLQEASGERRLTNLLHLAELLQKAGTRLDGEQALIRWLAAQIEGEGESDDERILRLESDDQLVKVVTVYKSKGLEYPLVFLPFAVSARRIGKGRNRFLEIAERGGTRRIDFSLAAEAIALADQARLEEELRLFYVALTRARHALWMGVASLDGAFHHCAFGYLLAGGNPVVAAALTQTMRDACSACAHIDIEIINTEETGCTVLTRDEQEASLGEAAEFGAQFERGWSVSSYTSITRDLGPAPAPAVAAAPSTPAEDKLLEDDDVLPLALPQGMAAHQRANPWHRFPRGSLPGQFLHAQLEWLAAEGFAAARDADFGARLASRCERAGWGHHQDDTIEWMHAASTTALPPLGASLAELPRTIPEMEFWVPLERVSSRAIDALCRAHLLPGEERPALAERELQGMLRGFQDLVFEHDGRYWVLDYKSNQLAADDAGYHADALAKAVAANRYDVQGTIYLLALHRLLKCRLGEDYDPAEALGGVVFFFLRGIGNPVTRGCHHMPALPELLDELEALLTEQVENTWA
ncbi:exodeoxyribonuclease V subunit beta [Noviherbaspirillum sp. CPCC 100848]|uniref:RecBCD enzyme subunit RecB n=1 Tax=Noviherbaspirillum album TaxID=3080276 RepID=A0ABU6J9A9_9BURK|nr:exodeoxyribonuclease V subunit beta [Noviherbaspirillum sp. CPCC 100848]MEC4719862.1 exodeoxyribonuclease V subunit beta [Noviherbaspirillum sp. CPCC 100848]